MKILLEKYPDYIWVLEEDFETKDVSGANPINVQGKMFPESDVLKAVELSGVASDYGGCGPIAMMGIMDYFARYLGYTEIIEDPTNSNDRVELARYILENVMAYNFGSSGDKATLVLPGDYVKGYDDIIMAFGLSEFFSAESDLTLFGGRANSYWNIVVENIQKGLPVTFYTGTASGKGTFAEHYTNIYGYEKWIGINLDTYEKKEKKFIKARVNWSEEKYDSDIYCDADIFNDKMIGLITYDIKYQRGYNVYASDFAEEFVNSSGGGQYFFDPISTPVTVDEDRMIYTERLRCSYIENQYLVLSPARKDAGRAYLDIELPHSASSITFDASLWSDSEGIFYERFIIQYYKDGEWINHVEYDLDTFSIFKYEMKTYHLLFSKDVKRIKFLAEYSKPDGDRNKGRIVLDNLKFNYNI